MLRALLYPKRKPARTLSGLFTCQEDWSTEEFKEEPIEGQVILGEDNFVESLVDHLKKQKDIPEIPKSQRYANRPSLDKIFQESIIKDKRKRDRKLAEAIEKHGYRQSEIARHLGLHTSTVSNLVRKRS